MPIHKSLPQEDPQRQRAAVEVRQGQLDATAAPAPLSAAPPRPHALTAPALLQLQRTLGNQAVQREITDASITEQKKKDFAYQYQKLRKFLVDFERRQSEWQTAKTAKDPGAQQMGMELSKDRGRYNSTKRMIQAIDSASDETAKAEILFSDMSSYGSALEDAGGQAEVAFSKASASGEASAEATRAQVVLGRTADTWGVPNADGHKAILAVDPNYYTLALNDAFMKGGLDLKAEFGLVTPLQDETKEFLKRPGITSKDLIAYAEQAKAKERLLWSDWGGGQPSVSCRELGQLLDDGYRYYEIPDPKGGASTQMMIPKANESLLDEIRAAGGKTKSQIEAESAPPEPPAPSGPQSAMAFWKQQEARAQQSGLKATPDEDRRGRL